MIMKQNHGLPIIHLALKFFCAKSFYWLMVNRIPVIIRESLHQIISVLTVWYLFRFICLVCYRRRSVTLDTCTKHLIRRNPCLMLKGLRLYEETQFPQWQRFAISLNDLFIHNLLLNRYHISYFGVLLYFRFSKSRCEFCLKRVTCPWSRSMSSGSAQSWWRDVLVSRTSLSPKNTAAWKAINLAHVCQLWNSRGKVEWRLRRESKRGVWFTSRKCWKYESNCFVVGFHSVINKCWKGINSFGRNFH